MHWRLFSGGFLLTCLTFALPLPGSARDWLEFRGPTGQGLIAWDDVPLHWNTHSNVVWKQAIPGVGWSSPILKSGRLYLTTAIKSTNEGALSLRVACFKESSGELLWDREVFAPGPNRIASIHTKNSQASATPLIVGNRLYAHFGYLGTACLKLDGTVVWKNDSIRYEPVHGNGGSPVLVGDVLIFTCDGFKDPFVVGLEAKSGRELWRAPRSSSAKKKFSFCTPIVIKVNGRNQVITPGSGVVSALDPKNGREIWRADYGDGFSVVPRPVYSPKAGLLFIATGFERPTVIAVRPTGTGDVTSTNIAWQLVKGAPNTPSPLLVGDELYLVSDGGIASCVDALTGKVHWQERVGGNYSASPVYSAGRIYFQNEEGTCVVIKASKEFTKVAENSLGERCLASFAAGRQAFYIRTEENLFKISSR